MRYHASIYVGHDGDSPRLDGPEFADDVIDYDEQGIEATSPEAVLDQVEERVRGELGRAMELATGTELGIQLCVDGEDIDDVDGGVRMVTL